MSTLAKWAHYFCLLLSFCWEFHRVSTGKDALTDDWYTKLEQPSYTAPAFIFGPVWAVLYLLMAISGWLLYLEPSSPQRTEALTWYGLQLGLNFSWSIIFFEYHQLFLSVVVIIAIWIGVLMTMIKSWPVNRWVTYMFIPNILWITYATWINIVIWLTN